MRQEQFVLHFLDVPAPGANEDGKRREGFMNGRLRQVPREIPVARSWVAPFGTDDRELG